MPLKVPNEKSICLFVILLLSFCVAEGSEAQFPQPLTSEVYGQDEDLILLSEFSLSNTSNDVACTGGSHSIELMPWYRIDRPLCHRWADGTLFTHAQGGVSYFDTPGESKFGGYEGAIVGLNLGNEVYVLGDYYANQISRASQYYGSIGIFQGPRYWEDGWSSRIGGSLMVGQFIDTRFDDVSLSQLRMSLDYSMSAQSQIGINYTEPIADDVVSQPVDLFGLGSQRIIRTSQRIGGHLKARVGEAHFRAGIGYRQKSRSILLGASANIAFNERCRAVTTVSYQDQGAWIGLVGLQYAFGPRRRMDRQQFLGIELPNDAIKINNDLRETPALLVADQTRWELFEEGVVSLSE